jgi:hypothetical protein
MAKTQAAQKKAIIRRADDVAAKPASAKTEPVQTTTNGSVPLEDIQTDEVVASGPELKLEVTEGDSPEKPKTKSHYPEGTKLFRYQPKGGGEIIEFPMEFENPSKEWLWELNDMPFLVQTWAWMRKANVPKPVQRLAVRLQDDDEYAEMFKQWFAAMGGGATPGE